MRRVGTSQRRAEVGHHPVLIRERANRRVTCSQGGTVDGGAALSESSGPTSLLWPSFPNSPSVPRSIIGPAWNELDAAAHRQTDVGVAAKRRDLGDGVDDVGRLLFASRDRDNNARHDARCTDSIGIDS